MRAREFAERRKDATRVDYVHKDEHASLGFAALDRSPVAFLPEADRPLDLYPIARFLPPAYPLAEVIRHIPQES